MTVNITWSSTNGGAAITSLDHGSGAAGNNLTEQEIFIRHDGSNQLTQCKFYVEGSGGDAVADLTELVAWGDATDSDDFGGLQLNMDAINSYASTWPLFNDKYGTVYNVIRTGAGDTYDNGISLPVAMGLTGSAGTIQTGSSPNVRFKCRMSLPVNASVGARQFDLKLRFSYTS